jgi:hypothetical protein
MWGQQREKISLVFDPARSSGANPTGRGSTDAKSKGRKFVCWKSLKHTCAV